ncbi:hypothetical protein D3C78_1502890 [compost metagenome]
MPLLLTGVHPLPLPNGKVCVLDCKCGQLDPLVEFDQFFYQHRHRLAVGDDMVQRQHQYMIVLCQVQQTNAQQRTLLQVERQSCFGFDPLAHICFSPGIDYKIPRHRRVNHLYSLLTVLTEGGA